VSFSVTEKEELFGSITADYW